MKVDFAYNALDREYTRVQEQQLADVVSFIQHLPPGLFTRRDVVWLVEEKIIFPKLKKGASIKTKRVMRLKIVYISWSCIQDFIAGEEAQEESPYGFVRKQYFQNCIG